MIFYQYELLQKIYHFLDYRSQNFFSFISRFHYCSLRKPHTWLITADFIASQQKSNRCQYINKFIDNPYEGIGKQLSLRLGAFLRSFFNENGYIYIKFTSFVNQIAWYYQTGVCYKGEIICGDFFTSFEKCCYFLVVKVDTEYIETIIDFSHLNSIKTFKRTYNLSKRILFSDELRWIYNKGLFNWYQVDFCSLKYHHQIVCSDYSRLIIFYKINKGFKLFRWKDTFLLLEHELTSWDGFILNENTIVLYDDCKLCFLNLLQKRRTNDVSFQSKIRVFHKISFNEFYVVLIDGASYLVKYERNNGDETSVIEQLSADKDLNSFDFASKDADCVACINILDEKWEVTFMKMNQV